MILFPVGPKCWHDWDQKLWRYLYCKYHFRANNRCDRNVPCLVSEQLIQGLHCSCLTPPVMVPTACRNDMISASIQQMLHLGVSFSDSPIWIYPWSPQKWARTRRGVSITEPEKEGSTVAITAEGDPQYHFYSHREAEYFWINHRWLWHRIPPNTDILQSHSIPEKIL